MSGRYHRFIVDLNRHSILNPSLPVVVSRRNAPQLSATGDARMLRSTKTQIDRRFRATGRDQTQARSCRPRPDVGGRKRAHVALRRAATSCDGRTCATWSNSTPTTRRLHADYTPTTRWLVAIRRRNAHIACDPATDQLPFDARALMSPAILRPIGRCQLPIISRPLVADLSLPASFALRLVRAY